MASNPYSENPFRLLGIPATSSTRDVRRRLEELSVQADLGLAPGGLAREHLMSLRQRFDEPSSRLKSELFWFHSPETVVSPSIQVQDLSEVAATLAALQSLDVQGSVRVAAIAQHDRAVLLQAGALEGGQLSRECHALALQAWAQVIASDEFWTYMCERAGSANDPRLNASNVEALRATLPAAVLEPVSELAAEAARTGDWESCAALVGAIRDTALPYQAVEVAEVLAVSPVLTEIKEGVRAVELATSQLFESTSGGVAQQLSAVTALLVTRVISPYERLVKLEVAVSEPMLLDWASRATWELARAAVGACKDWEHAIAIANEAVTLASSSAVQVEVRAERDELQFNYHLWLAEGARSRRDIPRAMAHMELAARICSDPEIRREILQECSHNRQRFGPAVAAQVNALIHEESALPERRLPRPRVVPQRRKRPAAQPKEVRSTTQVAAENPSRAGSEKSGQIQPRPETTGQTTVQGTGVKHAQDQRVSLPDPSQEADARGSNRYSDGVAKPPDQPAWWGAFPHGRVDAAPPPRKSRFATSLPVSLVKAVAATSTVLIVLFLLGSSVAALVSETSPDASSVGASFFVTYAVVLGISVWMGRQVGWSWLLFGALAWIAAFPRYVYLQNRGQRTTTSGASLPKFRTARVSAVMLAVCVVFGVASAIVGSMEEEQPAIAVVPDSTATTTAVATAVLTPTISEPTRAPAQVEPSSTPTPESTATVAPEQPGVEATERTGKPSQVPRGGIAANTQVVLSGDSIKVRVQGQDMVVRLAGIKAGSSPSSNDGCYSAQARQWLAAILPPRQLIYLVRGNLPDRNADESISRYVWVPKEGEPETLLVNELLLREGYAMLVDTVPDGRYARRLERAAETAGKETKDPWSTCAPRRSSTTTPDEDGSSTIQPIGDEAPRVQRESGTWQQVVAPRVKTLISGKTRLGVTLPQNTSRLAASV